MHLRLHKFLPLTRVEGPGERACIWVQGCPIRCPGCAVPWTWPDAGGSVVLVEELARRILNGPSVEGITFLGGEPFAQAAALAELGGILQSVGLSVMTFTGYTLDYLRAGDRPEWLRLLHVTDLLVDGPFVESSTNLSRPWIGSSNQRYHFLTERYRYLEASLKSIRNRIEIHLLASGEVQVNGMIRPADLRSMSEPLKIAEAQARVSLL